MTDETTQYDFVVIGAGIAGASVAAQLVAQGSVLLLEMEPALHLRAAHFLQLPQHDARGHRFARAAFPHQRHPLAGPDVERDAVQHLGHAGIAAELQHQVFDAQNLLHWSAPRISRRASPTRLKPNTATRMASPGKTVSHQLSGR